MAKDIEMRLDEGLGVAVFCTRCGKAALEDIGVPPYCFKCCTSPAEQVDRTHSDAKGVKLLNEVMNYLHTVRSDPKHYPFMLKANFKADPPKSL
jgi:hypothetical protein